MDARDIVTRARTQLIIHRPFFGQVALMLEVVETDAIPTLATDGKRLMNNPEFVKQLSAARLEVAICHEILHAALAHPARFLNRDPTLWKIATDYAINPILKDCGFDVSWLLYRKDFHGLDADTIYYKLREEAEKRKQSGKGDDPDGDKDGDGEGTPNGFASQDGHEACGGLHSGAKDEAEAKELERDMKQMMARASTVAKMQGSLPGSLERLVDAMMKPKVNWREKLRHFMERAARNDYSWTRANRRHLSRGFTCRPSTTWRWASWWWPSIHPPRSTKKSCLCSWRSCRASWSKSGPNASTWSTATRTWPRSTNTRPTTCRSRRLQQAGVAQISGRRSSGPRITTLIRSALSTSPTWRATATPSRPSIPCCGCRRLGKPMRSASRRSVSW